MNNLDKKEVIEFFGNGSRTAEALYISPSAVCMWADTLGVEITLKVLGAALLHHKRLKKAIPAHWLEMTE